MTVRTGLDGFLAGEKAPAGLARGARLGLVCHPASVSSTLEHAADRLAASDRFRLVRLFGPEHGIRGEAQDMEAVADTDVVSLYGATPASLKPKPEHLEGLDAVVVDLQDVGSRYYTYVYTMSFVMEAARDAALPVVVLDRPNPIGGTATEGPVLDPSMSSFVGRYPVPVRHGMTAGELASLFNEVHGIGCDLRVVTMTGWRRTMHFSDTGLPWVAPSPNMPSETTALVYPGGCLLEGTNLSEGRGTTLPFELVGAPFLDGTELAATLARRALPGVAFRAAGFRPMFQKHAGKTVQGVQVHVTDRARFRPFATYLALIQDARRLAGASFDWRREAYEFETERLAIDLLLGAPGLRDLLEADAPLSEMEASWMPALEAFRETRERFLLYPPGPDPRA